MRTRIECQIGSNILVISFQGVECKAPLEAKTIEVVVAKEIEAIRDDVGRLADRGKSHLIIDRNGAMAIVEKMIDMVGVMSVGIPSEMMT